MDRLAVHLGGYPLADTEIKDERTEDEKTIDQLMGRAEVLYYAEDYHKAIIIWDSILVIKPENSVAWNNKGVALGKIGHYEEAIAAYDKAIQIKRRGTPARCASLTYL